MKAPSSRSHNAYDSEFVNLSDRLAKHHDTYGVRLRPYVSTYLPHFSLIPDPLKTLILTAIRENAALLDEMASAGEALNDSPRLLWRSLRRLGWVPRPDIFDKIEDGDVVELYDSSKIQVFRNLAFFNFTSLTLEEIVSFPLGVMFDIDPNATDFHIKTAERIIRQEITETERFDIGPYETREKAGERLRIRIHPKWISPVTHANTCVGVIAIHRPEILDGIPD